MFKYDIFINKPNGLRNINNQQTAFYSQMMLLYHGGEFTKCIIGWGIANENILNPIIRTEKYIMKNIFFKNYHSQSPQQSEHHVN